MVRPAVAGLVLLAATGCVLDRERPVSWSELRIVDLTHPFDHHTIVWPTEHEFRLVRQQTGTAAGGYYYASNRLELPEHGGTHIDAPIHFSEGAQTLDQIPPTRLMGPAVHVDVSSQCALDRDYRVTVTDFEDWERTHGPIPKGAIVLIDTGFARFWPSRKEYLGTEQRGAAGVAKLHFPGLHEESGRWLARERHVKAVGIDTASIDHGPSTGFETHVALLSQNIPVFENVADLRALPAVGFDVIALPMHIAGGTGGPLRIVALLP